MYTEITEYVIMLGELDKKKKSLEPIIYKKLKEIIDSDDRLKLEVSYIMGNWKHSHISELKIDNKNINATLIVMTGWGKSGWVKMELPYSCIYVKKIKNKKILINCWFKNCEGREDHMHKYIWEKHWEEYYKD